jgi:Family of unknown function (DUF6551)
MDPRYVSRPPGPHETPTRRAVPRVPPDVERARAREEAVRHVPVEEEVAAFTEREIEVDPRLVVPYTLEKVLVKDIRFDARYQAKVPRSQRWAEQIAREFDPDKLRPVDLSLREDGSYYCMDGGHRVTALTLMGWSDQLIPAHVYRGLTLAQEAKIFNTQDATRRLTAQQRFRSRLLEGEQTAHEIRRDVEAAGYVLNLDDSRGGDGKIVAVAALDQVRHSIGRRRFQALLRLCRSAWQDDTIGLSSPVLIGLSSLVGRYDGLYDVRRLVTKMADSSPAMLERDAREMRKIVGLGTYAKDAVGMILVDRYNQRLQVNKLPNWQDMDARMRRTIRDPEQTAHADPASEHPAPTSETPVPVSSRPTVATSAEEAERRRRITEDLLYGRKRPAHG